MPPSAIQIDHSLLSLLSPMSNCIAYAYCTFKKVIGTCRLCTFRVNNVQIMHIVVFRLQNTKKPPPKRRIEARNYFLISFDNVTYPEKERLFPLSSIPLRVTRTPHTPSSGKPPVSIFGAPFWSVGVPNHWATSSPV